MKKIEFINRYTFDFEATTSEPVCAYMVSIVNIEDPSNATIFTIDDGDPVELLLKFIKKSKKNSKFYAHNLSYDYAIIRAWCHFNPENEYIPSFKDFILPNRKILKSTLNFKYKPIHLIDSYPLFLAPLNKVMGAFTPLKKGETPLYEKLDDVVVTQEDKDYRLNDSIGLAIAFKKDWNSVIIN
ncbi:hypothetical protein BAnh1_01000 [Bartonella australis AUST/NH1]|uniref:DNA-directed DNA polymerase n=1 Tax=Bartonella australis (strain Aust/NH1) TaxID=1094489 RepID=M1NRQ1_BARAA|nr:DNA polymerase [Bartonella australis]AGF73993.1 hypothetical protein BAnh1_01000 [Bartonella australis AUST/NH1]